MIIGVGCDIVDHETTSKLGWDRNPPLLSRIFTQTELSYPNPQNKIRYLAGRFAAKEAVLKAIGIGMEDGISLTEIQILQSKNGSVTVELLGNLKNIALLLGIMSIKLSISHSTQHSLAFAVAQGKSVEIDIT
jgi:holo-[acyl-carrier protein] synthase